MFNMTTQAKEALVEEFNNHVNFADLIDDMITSVGEVCKPEDVFDDSQLAEWAEENGFKKED